MAAKKHQFDVDLENWLGEVSDCATRLKNLADTVFLAAYYADGLNRDSSAASSGSSTAQEVQLAVLDVRNKIDTALKHGTMTRCVLDTLMNQELPNGPKT
jgi:hypothetical protein